MNISVYRSHIDFYDGYDIVIKNDINELIGRCELYKNEEDVYIMKHFTVTAGVNFSTKCIGSYNISTSDDQRAIELATKLLKGLSI